MRQVQSNTASGFTLIELLVSLVVAALLFAGLSSVVTGVLGSREYVSERVTLTRDAEFAMDRMVRMVSHSRLLLLPLADKTYLSSNWPENIREETVPASPPTGSSIRNTAVLAVTLPAFVDLDFDGIPDADDDGDGLIDEDLPNDFTHDFYPGIPFIDDDGDGWVDEAFFHPFWDDDESLDYNEDAVDGVDSDGDNNIDEDPSSDMNDDGCPGLCGVDDDGDGAIDEGSYDDDDEDGGSFDDPYDPVVYFLNGATLIERLPAPWNTDGISVPDGPVDGRDFIESPIADNVSRLRFERLLTSAGQPVLVDITLELTTPAAGTVSLNTRVRIGGAL